MFYIVIFFNHLPNTSVIFLKGIRHFLFRHDIARKCPVHLLSKILYTLKGYATGGERPEKVFEDSGLCFIL
jgi:hypothetical protein